MPAIQEATEARTSLKGKRVYLSNIRNTILQEQQGQTLHVDAMQDGLRKEYGREDIVVARGREIAGLTDPGITIKTAIEYGIPDAEAIERNSGVLAQEAQYFKEHVGEGKYRVTYGANKLAVAVREQGDILGIASGNIREVGETMLSVKPTLNSQIAPDVRFYSDKFRERREMYGNAAEELRRRGAIEVVILDQSAHGIKAAKDVGLKAIGAKVGNYSKEELMDAGADKVVDRFDEKGRGEIVNFLNRNSFLPK